jgi:hypothetical protein
MTIWSMGAEVFSAAGRVVGRAIFVTRLIKKLHSRFGGTSFLYRQNTITPSRQNHHTGIAKSHIPLPILC